VFSHQEQQRLEFEMLLTSSSTSKDSTVGKANIYATQKTQGRCRFSSVNFHSWISAQKHIGCNPALIGDILFVHGFDW
jgi:hypothetical protein